MTVKSVDIGCNSGELTLALHEQLRQMNKPVHTIGIDIDPVLIKRAKSLLVNNDFGEVDFRTMDLMREDERQRFVAEFCGKFDICFCFGVTMWIHLNHGDEGLQQFLRWITSHCEFLLLEPQTWKCYRNASRRMRRQDKTMFQNLDSFKWKVDVLDRIDAFIRNECAMEIVNYFGTTEWGRPVTLYRRNKPVPTYISVFFFYSCSNMK